MEALRQIEGWDAPHAGAAVVRGEEVIASYGETAARLRIASIAKIVVAYAALVGVEDGTVDLDAPAGPPGSTVRHLLCHASGLGFDGSEKPVPAGTRRIYSNPGYEALGHYLERVWDMPLRTYLDEGVFGPLGMCSSALEGSPAHGVWSTVDDLTRFAAELLRPTLVDPGTLAEATTVQLPGLKGMLPGVGQYDPLDWGLGFELRDGKRPHWTGSRNSAATFGHFGGAGTMLWVDPAFDVALVALTAREFGPWALEAWPALSDAVLTELT
jgi:CubicO group peptidase (beta-lactamase class C family)